MIFNAMIEAMLFMQLLLGILIDIGKIIISGIRTLFAGGAIIISKMKEVEKNERSVN